jgi:GH15 family glucan-1,4-alpha-glucosidase
MMCAVALGRAAALAEQNLIPKRHLAHWRSEAAAIGTFVEAHCWSDEKRSYLRAAGSDELDASLLLAALHQNASPSDARLRSTIDVISRELRHGPARAALQRRRRSPR